MYGIFHIRSVSVGLDSQIWYLFIYITGYLNVRKISETMDFRTFVGPLKTFYLALLHFCFIYLVLPVSVLRRQAIFKRSFTCNHWLSIDLVFSSYLRLQRPVLVMPQPAPVAPWVWTLLVPPRPPWSRDWPGRTLRRNPPLTSHSTSWGQTKKI